MPIPPGSAPRRPQPSSGLFDFLNNKGHKQPVKPTGRHAVALGPKQLNLTRSSHDRKAVTIVDGRGTIINSDNGNNYTGFIYATGSTLNYLGRNNISTRVKFGGTTPGTSLASQYFRQTTWGQTKTPPWLFKRLPKRVGLRGVSMPVRSPNLGAVAGRSVPLLGRTFIVVGAGCSVYNIATADNKVQALSTEAGGMAGAYAGAEAGAAAGAAIGVWIGGVGAAPGALIGGLVGGAVGYHYGSEAGQAIYDKVQEGCKK